MKELRKGNISYIYTFDSLDDCFLPELNRFWEDNASIYQEEISSFGINLSDQQLFIEGGDSGFHERRSGAIALTEKSQIAGEVFVVLAKTGNDDLISGEYCYYQNIYVEPKYRSYRIMSNLYGIFLRNFVRSRYRDERVSSLVADNRNPTLKTPFIRKYFIECGFQMHGINARGGEVWTKPLDCKLSQ